MLFLLDDFELQILDGPLAAKDPHHARMDNTRRSSGAEVPWNKKSAALVEGAKVVLWKALKSIEIY